MARVRYLYLNTLYKYEKIPFLLVDLNFRLNVLIETLNLNSTSSGGGIVNGTKNANTHA